MNDIIQIGDLVGRQQRRSVYVVTGVYEGFYQVKQYIEHHIVTTKIDFYGFLQNYNKIENVDALDQKWYKITDIPKKKYHTNQKVFAKDDNMYSDTCGDIAEAKIIAIAAEMNNPYDKTSMNYFYILSKNNDKNGYKIKMFTEQNIFPNLSANSVWNNLCSENLNSTK